jgi:hypothetical protein
MRCHGRGLVVVGAARADLWTIDASKEMPFVLVEELVSIHEPCPPTKNDRPEVGDIKAEFLVQFPARGCLGRLALLDTSARRIPIQPAVGIRIKQEQQAIPLVEQEHTRDLALDHRRLLHRAESLGADGERVNEANRCPTKYTLGASGNIWESPPKAGRSKQEVNMDAGEQITAAGLICALEAGGGILRVTDPADRVWRAYRRAIHAARASDAVPQDKRLKLRGRDQGELVIRLVPAADGVPRTAPEPIPLPDGDDRQAVTAAGDGCRAAIDAERWLEEHEPAEAADTTAG